MPTLAAVEAESLLDTLFLFFWDQFLWKFDHINIYSIEVLDHSRGGGKRLESLSGPSTVLGNLFCSIPLVLEVDSLGIPVIDLIRDSVNGHDLLHEWNGDSGSEEANEDIMVCDAGAGDIALKGGNVTLKQRGELSIFLGHTMGGKPGDGIPSSVLVFKYCLECGKEVIPHF